MKLIVGVPVFRIPDLVRRCLTSLADSPADILVVDNAADLDVKAVLGEFSGKIQVITNATNTFCNGAWNKIMEYGLLQGYDLIGLGSSDAELLPGWHEALQQRMNCFSDEVWIPSLREGADVEYADSVAGYFSFLPRAAVKLVYPIPAGLKHWFGDQYMFEKLRRSGWKTAVLQSVKARHQQSAVTAATSEAYAVIEQDKLAWRGPL